MQRLLDILASGVHDAKNQLFVAESIIAAAERTHSVDLAEARYAIEAAAGRLSRTLATYRLLRQGATLAVVPTVIADLCDEVVLAQGKHLLQSGVRLETDLRVADVWPLDRDLVGHILNNAVQNAGRYARSRVLLTAAVDAGDLILRVEDDGPGYPDPATAAQGGTGLLVGERLAALHVRHGRSGALHLTNGGALGGAIFELRLP